MKVQTLCLAALAALGLICTKAEACTNVIITKGASADGSNMISYAADSHWLFGELYYRPAGRFKKGAMLQIREWDTNKPLGEIAQVERTFQTVGNMNEHQLIIGETTWGGREELVDSTGIMDYGSLIYITLQRARTAREAIDTIVALANRYGYPSEGETFSIADTQEAWIMDFCGKGPDDKGIVWVARRIPDGYICAHANQARITRFPLNDPETLYAPDVISFAREKGWFTGEDADFSFRDAYNPLDFGGARSCDARAWVAFRVLGDGKFTYEQDGQMITRNADEWQEYALGHDLKGEMPLWIKPERKITVKDVADVMRNHYEGTALDMSKDPGAGGTGSPIRWGYLSFEWNGKKYAHERPIATRQTGFWFVGQARPWLPDALGALLWFGTDDAATSYLTPIYVNINKVPECLREGNGNLISYSPTSQFWICNRVAQACYKMYSYMAPTVRCASDAFEQEQMFHAVPENDAKLISLAEKGRTRKLRKLLTKYTINTAQKQFEEWKKLEELLLVKYLDGNIKAQEEDGSFKHSEYSDAIPDGLVRADYDDAWKQAVATQHGDILEQK